jgi:hypothetical protein
MPQFIPVNVEDLYGYVSFIENVMKINESKEKIKALEFLTNKVNPLAIGALYRAREKNKSIAENLMRYHLKDEDRIKSIAEKLTMGLYMHSFIISRKDAIDMNLPIENNIIEMEKLIEALFLEYSTSLKLNEPFHHEIELGSENKKVVNIDRALIESVIKGGDGSNNPELLTYTFQSQIELNRINIMNPDFGIPLPQVIEKNIRVSWVINNGI